MKRWPTMSWTRKSNEGSAAPALVNAKALQLLARREHSRSELRQKLLQRDYPLAMIEECLEALEQQGLLNQSRYAHSYAASRAAKGYGPMRVSAELRQRGIEPTCIDSALAELAAEWMEHLQQLHRKRFHAQIPANHAERQQQAQFFRQRGFTSEQIKQLFAALEAA